MNNDEHSQIGEGKNEANDLTPLNIIRTETVISRLPIHNLAKTGRVNIQIVRKTGNGEIDLRWEVSYSDRYGQPRQLAYKLDTVVINRRIDEEGRPLPRMIRIGSLREIAEVLGLGGDTNSVRKALRQNASAFITAKFKYTGNDGTERSVEADFTRYSVVFTGEKLPDGRRADAVYILLNDPYREVVNNAPVRPLDYDYLKLLPPAAQRFYEIVSRKIFAALKYGHDQAKLPYSEFCMFSAQQRHFDYDHFKKQMYKVHRPHLKSSYINKIEYEQRTDEEGKRDWLMLYTPGPKAQAEFQTFNGLPVKTRRTRQRRLSTNGASADSAVIGTAPSDSEPNQTLDEAVPQLKKHRTPTQGLPYLNSNIEGSSEQDREVDQKLLAALTERGVFESTAIKLLAPLPTDRLEVIQDYIDYWDSIHPEKRGPGLLHSLIQNGDPLPANFETGRKREERLAAEDRRQKLGLIKDILTTAYEEHRHMVVDRFIAEQFPAEEFERRVADRKKEAAAQTELWNRGRSPEALDQIARQAVRADIGKEVTLLSFEDFRQRELPRILSELHFDPAELGIEIPKPDAPQS